MQFFLRCNNANGIRLQREPEDFDSPPLPAKKVKKILLQRTVHRFYIWGGGVQETVASSGTRFTLCVFHLLIPVALTVDLMVSRISLF